MDNVAQTQEETPILKAKVKISIYFLMAFTFFLLAYLVISLSDYLSWYGWILVVAMMLGLIAAITTFKTIELYTSGFQIKYIINKKTTFYKYSDITNYSFFLTTESFIKMKIVKFWVNDKEKVFSTFLYGKIVEQLDAEFTQRIKN